MLLTDLHSVWPSLWSLLLVNYRLAFPEEHFKDYCSSTSPQHSSGSSFLFHILRQSSPWGP